MKKKIAAMMVGFMVIGGMGSAFAAEAVTNQTPKSKLVEKVKENKGASINRAREYKDDLHVINSLRAERLSWKAQIVGKQDEILDLTVAADDNGNYEALQAAKQVHADIRVLNKENGELMKAFASDLAAFREADKAKDTVLAHSKLSEASGVLAEVNGNLKEKAELLDEIISILQ
ncbi:hypothetical protein PaeBR_16840 [Paenibacillus sp. BR2-3]|uniref:hypothetical protein n=1 Tax=Paenibacillus sp. BR2-3 TaxID=3048494 RepID=UPI003977D6F6